MDQFNTIACRGAGEYEEKKSKFLAAAIPIASEEEAQEHLKSIRKQYYDARHHCFAYILGEKSETKRFSDDGEPQGTAGAPILKVLEGKDVTGALVVVTRYFGGTLLGTGGLVRAYTEAAQRSLADAGIVTMSQGEIHTLTMEYGLYDKVNYMLSQNLIQIEDTSYTDKVTVTIKLSMDQIPLIQEKIQTIGGGTILEQVVEKGFYGFDIT